MAFFSITIDIILIASAIAIVTNVFYRLLVDQQNARYSRERIRELNAKMKEQQKLQDKKEVDALFKEVMSEQGKLMRMSFKPMIASLVITLLAVPWIGSIYGDKLIELKDGKGSVLLDAGLIEVSGNSVSAGGRACEMPCTLDAGGYSFNAEPSGGSVKIAPLAASLPFSVPFVGNDLGWLGWYFLSFLFVMMASRRLLKIYV